MAHPETTRERRLGRGAPAVDGVLVVVRKAFPVPSDSPAPSPAAFRSPNRGITTFLWVGVLVLAAAGLVYAAVDVSNGTATSGSADSSFAAPPPAAEPDLVQPTRGPAATPAVATPKVDPIERAAAQAAREREADVLIEQLKAKLRAEREARIKDRATR